jgi:multiple sugar transport system ATP-binding protein
MPLPANESTIVARFNARSRVRTDDTVDVAVDTSELHFFDPESGLGIYDETTTGEDA